MPNKELTDTDCISGGLQPKGGSTISENCESDISSGAGLGASIERGRDSGDDATQLDENGLTIDEACKVIHCSREWLRRKIHSGEIPAYRVGRGLRVTRAAISQVAPRRSPGDPT